MSKHAQELASGGDLFRKGGKSYAQGDEHKAVKQVMIPMLKALQYLHEKVNMKVVYMMCFFILTQGRAGCHLFMWR